MCGISISVSSEVYVVGCSSSPAFFPLSRPHFSYRSVRNDGGGLLRCYEITAAWIFSIIRHSMDNLLNFTFQCLGLSTEFIGSLDRLHPSLKLFVATLLTLRLEWTIVALSLSLPTYLLSLDNSVDAHMLYRPHYPFAGEFETRDDRRGYAGIERACLHMGEWGATTAYGGYDGGVL